MPKGVYDRSHIDTRKWQKPRPHVRRPLSDRFADKYVIEPNSGCWLWIGAATNAGYGLIGLEAGRNILATHAALILDGRARPSPEHMACHKCDTPSCVNPSHLFWGSQDENMADQQRKGRHWATVKSACKAGHLWTSENTRIGQDGRKNCRICETSRAERRREQKRATRISVANG